MYIVSNLTMHFSFTFLKICKTNWKYKAYQAYIARKISGKNTKPFMSAMFFSFHTVEYQSEVDVYLSFQISYVSFLDIWMVSCIGFITLVLLEFPIVHTLIRKDRKPAAEKFENFALAILPVVFLIYNLVYWCLLFDN